MIQEMLASRPIRITRASASPIRRALACWATGSRPETIERKMTLSMPSTISSAVSVSRLAQAFGSESSSSIATPVAAGVGSPLTQGGLADRA